MRPGAAARADDGPSRPRASLETTGTHVREEEFRNETYTSSFTLVATGDDAIEQTVLLGRSGQFNPGRCPRGSRASASPWPAHPQDCLRILLRARDTDTVAATAELPRGESPDADGQIRDVRSTEQVDAAVRAAADRYGPVDALVDNTGRQRRREAQPTD
ncbi:SDR family NAD(P)-dependent oxidoreductase [Streptomyces halstedii]|uniref:SDR family NAD(P)-dependent oxidoreductase n=1 Tax=Streptomyces halstedii TaxID=1944 RepID=UPI0037F855C4